MKQYVFSLLLLIGSGLSATTAPSEVPGAPACLEADVKELCSAVEKLHQKMCMQEKMSQHIISAVTGAPITPNMCAEPLQETETIYRKAREIISALGIDDEIDASATKSCSSGSCSLRDCCCVVEKIFKSVGHDLHHDLKKCCKKLSECCKKTREDIEECCTDLHETITTCCQEILDAITAIPDCCDTVTAIFDTVTRIEVELNDCCTNLTAEINNSTTLIVDTITTCCEEIKDAITALPDCCDTVTAIFDTVTRIETELTECCACDATPITQEDFSSGTPNTYLLSTSGNYCLTEDVFGEITINGSNITLNLNDRLVTGRIIIDTTAINAKLLNGHVFANTAPTSNVDAGNGVIEIRATARETTIENITVSTANSSLFNGRRGIVNNGDNTTITSCSIIAGNAGIPAGNTAGLTGGTGIASSGLNALIQGCTIIGGSGNDANNGVGGAGGSGIQLALTSINTIINHCTITTQNGGNGAGAGAGNGGRGGRGIDVDGSEDTKVFDNRIIKTGNGGTGAGAGDGGPGGDAIFIGTNGLRTEVRNNTLSNTGTGGTGSPNGDGGRAVNDTNTSGTSTIYQNFAYNIANSPKYTINNDVSEGGVQLCGNPANSTNGCPCPCPFDNVYVPGTCTPCN